MDISWSHALLYERGLPLADIGGGYEERALANESLWWMLSGAQDAELVVDEDFLVVWREGMGRRKSY